MEYELKQAITRNNKKENFELKNYRKKMRKKTTITFYTLIDTFS